MLQIDSLAIEVTRRCNMGCAHCMRGDAQQKDMPDDILYDFLKQVSSIGCITFTGGEPTLNIDTIWKTLLICKEFQIPVNEFYIVTNGKEITTEFLNTLIDWYVYCIECNGEPEMSGVALSQDEFHEKIPYENVAKLRALSFFCPDDKKTRNWGNTNVLDLGRARSLTGHEKRAHRAFDIAVTRYGEVYSIDDTTIALTVNGDVLRDCDYEYDNIDHIRLCDYKDFSETIQRIHNDPDFKC